MSSKAFASRGASWNDCVAPLKRYTAVTVRTSVYDVLNTGTSETDGTPPTPVPDATVGSVTSAGKGTGARGKRQKRAPARRRASQCRCGFVPMVNSIYVSSGIEHSHL